MNINIRQVNNGFIITYPNPNGDGELTDVIECGMPMNPGVQELSQLQSLLYTITDAIGYYGNKHQEYRLRVIIERQQWPSEELAEEAGKLSEKLSSDECIIIEKSSWK